MTPKENLGLFSENPRSLKCLSEINFKKIREINGTREMRNKSGPGNPSLIWQQGQSGQSGDTLVAYVDR